MLWLMERKFNQPLKTNSYDKTYYNFWKTASDQGDYNATGCLLDKQNNETKVTLNLSSNMNVDSNDETNFPDKFLITSRQVSRICKAFANGSSAKIKLSKTKLFKMAQFEEFNVNLFNSVWNPF